jgi:hypothetical protein
MLLLLALAASASAQEHPDSRAVAGVFPQGFDQAVYKGLVGNVLDAIPMDPSGRLSLQRTNAVVSNTLFGRTLTVLAGLSNPVLLLGGFVWGIWAASNIEPVEAGIQLTADRDHSGGAAAVPERIGAILDRSSAVDDAPANTVPEPILLTAISSGDADAAARSRSRVIKIWLPQRSPLPLQ